MNEINIAASESDELEEVKSLLDWIITRNRLPLLEGAEDDDGSDDEVEDDLDDEDDDIVTMSREEYDKLLTKTAKSVGKKARRELARKYGFNSVAEMDAGLADRLGSSDEDEEVEEVDEETPKPARRNRGGNGNAPDQRDLTREARLRRREFRADIRDTLDSMKVKSSVLKVATSAVMGELDFDDPDLDATDVDEVIDDLVASNEEWFSAKAKGSGRVVPGTAPKSNKKSTQSLDELAVANYAEYKASKPKLRSRQTA